ncbi:copper-translocating P-type ATPase [Acholeplasma laidlawii]|uniref:copper-translocating P-type ATPase n=1 Tax=Acholeplasma laidlawii TaxID=2148 RepID=UPI003F922E62
MKKNKVNSKAVSNHHNHEHAMDDKHEHMNHHNHDDHNHHNHEHMNHHNHDDHNHHNHEHMNHHTHDDHNHHKHHHHGNFKKIFLISLPLGLIVMWLSPFMGIHLPFPFYYEFKYSDILALFISIILFIYGGKPFIQGAVTEFKNKEPGMMALVTMGISVSFIYSVFAVVIRYITGEHYMDFLFEFASLLLIMLLGHWIEMLALMKAGDAQESLAKLLPKNALLLKEHGEMVEVPISQLKINDVIIVQSGENVAADGIILKGESRVNESLLTGESVPVVKKVGDFVIGGSTNEYSKLEVKVTKTGKDAYLSQVKNLIMDAQSNPSRAENNAKKVAGWLFYLAIFAALISFVVWYLIEDLNSAILFSITTLIIACPHALGLAIPLVISRSTSIGSLNGVLVKDRQTYNLTTKADIVILDKTGTLTTGIFKVQHIDLLDNSLSEEEVISILYGIESASSHPIAQSIIEYAKNKDVKALKFDKINYISGKGLEGSVGLDTYEFISINAYKEPITIQNDFGYTVSILLKNNKAIGVVKLGDSLKTSSQKLIKELKHKGIRPIMATGDNEYAAKIVANKLDIEYYANQSPEDKYKLVEKFKKQGLIVIMMGDGINDAPSLALADVGVAIGAGTQVAIDSADVILTNSEPGDIASFIDLSFKTNRKMNQNLIWGAGYNFIAIPIAAGILAPFGLVLSPAIGGVLMSLSTVIVALNALSLNMIKS